MTNHADSMREAMAANGIDVAGHIIADGTLHRYHVKGDHIGSKNAWAILFHDDRPAGSFSCHKRFGGVPIKWKAEGIAPLTREARAELDARTKRSTSERAERERLAHKAAAELANTIWNAATPAEDDHPYLKRKGVPGDGLRVAAKWEKEFVDPVTGAVTAKRVPNALLVPIKNARKEIVSLQAIFESATNALGRGKDFLTGGEIKGCAFTIGFPTQVDGVTVIAITEGYATGASIHIATGLCVVVAFSAGNLLPVAETVRRLMPAANVIMAADNDRFTVRPINNPGVTSATRAADAVGGSVAVPEFADFAARSTDFQDLYALEGADEVKRQVLRAIRPAVALDTNTSLALS